MDVISGVNNVKRQHSHNVLKRLMKLSIKNIIHNGFHLDCKISCSGDNVTMWLIYYCVCCSFLTDGKSADGVTGAAARGKVAGSCTSQIEHSGGQGCRTSGGDDDSITVSPRVTRPGIIMRHTRQHVTLFERSTRRIHVH